MCRGELMIESRADNNAILKSDRQRLVVVDDCPDWGDFISEVAEKAGFCASAAMGHDDYAEISKAEPIDVLVLDLFMPKKDGIEMIMDMEHMDNRPFIILISGHNSVFLDTAVRLGRGKGLDIIGALTKPIRLRDLQALIQKAASLVEQKKKSGNEIRATHSTQQTKAKPSDMVIDHDHIAKHDFQDSGDRVAREKKQVMAFKQSFTQEVPRNFCNVASFPATESSLRRSIAEINAQFCIMLWDAQLATLNALSAVPGDLAEAADGVIAGKADAEEASDWQQALRINTQTLVDNQAAIGRIADAQQLPQHGRAATESINRLNTIVSEILAEKRTTSFFHARKLANFRELCSENDHLKENFAALLTAVNNARVRANDAAVSRSARTVGPSMTKPTEPMRSGFAKIRET